MSKGLPMDNSLPIPPEGWSVWAQGPYGRGKCFAYAVEGPDDSLFVSRYQFKTREAAFKAGVKDAQACANKP